MEEKLIDSQTERECLIMAKRIKAMSLKTNPNTSSSSSSSSSLLSKFGLIDWNETLQNNNGIIENNNTLNGFFLAPSRLDTNLTLPLVNIPARTLNSSDQGKVTS